MFLDAAILPGLTRRSNDFRTAASPRIATKHGGNRIDPARLEYLDPSPPSKNGGKQPAVHPISPFQHQLYWRLQPIFTGFFGILVYVCHNARYHVVPNVIDTITRANTVGMALRASNALHGAPSPIYWLPYPSFKPFWKPLEFCAGFRCGEATTVRMRFTFTSQTGCCYARRDRNHVGIAVECRQ